MGEIKTFSELVEYAREFIDGDNHLSELEKITLLLKHGAILLTRIMFDDWELR